GSRGFESPRAARPERFLSRHRKRPPPATRRERPPEEPLPPRPYLRGSGSPGPGAGRRTSRRAPRGHRRPAPRRERSARGPSLQGWMTSNLKISFITFSTEIQSAADARIRLRMNRGPLPKTRADERRLKAGPLRKQKEETMGLPGFRRGRSVWAVGLLGLALTIAQPPAPAGASSHREAPGIAKYPLWDNTDVYAFRDPIVTDQLTILANWIPLEDPSGFPNFFHFDENAYYMIHIDNDGDGVEDITYRFSFTEQVRNPNSFLQFLGPVSALNDPNINVYYTYTVDRIIGPSGN